MDPLSITAACAGVLSSIATLGTHITRFVRDVRDSRKDLDAVRRELSSLAFCVESLRDDTTGDDIPYPESLKSNLVAVLTNCNGIMVEMTTLLNNFSSNSLGTRLLWTTSGQGDMAKLRTTLEAHKAILDVAIDMVSIFLITSVKHDTSNILEESHAIKEDTAYIPGIKDDTAQLLDKISKLEARLSQTHDLQRSKADMLQRFLDSSTTYAESIVQQDFSGSDYDNPGEATKLEAEVDLRHARHLSINDPHSSPSEKSSNLTPMSTSTFVVSTHATQVDENVQEGVYLSGSVKGFKTREAAPTTQHVQHIPQEIVQEDMYRSGSVKGFNTREAAPITEHVQHISQQNSQAKKTHSIDRMVLEVRPRSPNGAENRLTSESAMPGSITLSPGEKSKGVEQQPLTNEDVKINDEESYMDIVEKLLFSRKFSQRTISQTLEVCTQMETTHHLLLEALTRLQGRPLSPYAKTKLSEALNQVNSSLQWNVREIVESSNSQLVKALKDASKAKRRLRLDEVHDHSDLYIKRLELIKTNMKDDYKETYEIHLQLLRTQKEADRILQQLYETQKRALTEYPQTSQQHRRKQSSQVHKVAQSRPQLPQFKSLPRASVGFVQTGNELYSKDVLRPLPTEQKRSKSASEVIKPPTANPDDVHENISADNQLLSRRTTNVVSNLLSSPIQTYAARAASRHAYLSMLNKELLTILNDELDDNEDAVIERMSNLVEKGANINVQNGLPLQLAACKGKIKLLQWILDNHDTEGLSSTLFSLVNSPYRVSQLDVARILLTAGANPNYMEGNESVMGNAAEHGYWSMVNELIEHGAESGIGVTLCQAQRLRSNLPITERLLARALKLQLPNTILTDAACLAAQYGSLLKVKMFVKAGVNVLNHDSQGRTMLQNAEARPLGSIDRKAIIAFLNKTEKQATKTKSTNPILNLFQK